MGYDYFRWFSWSGQKQKMATACLRQFYNRYRLPYQGWQKSAPELNQRAYMLSKMTSIPMLRGTLVHEQIEQNFAAYGDVSPETMVQSTLSSLYEHIDANKRQQYQTAPKKFPPLHEVYFQGLDPSPWVTEEFQQDLLKAYTYWKEEISSLFALANQISVIEQEALSYLWIEVPKIPEPVPVMLKLDMLYRTDLDDTYCLIDWKTGRNKQGAREQAKVYAAYIRQMYNTPLSELSINFWYLDLKQQDTFTFTQEEIDVHVSELCAEADILAGLYPDWKDIRSLSQDDFPQTQNKSACKFCAWKELCYADWKKELW